MILKQTFINLTRTNFYFKITCTHFTKLKSGKFEFLMKKLFPFSLFLGKGIFEGAFLHVCQVTFHRKRRDVPLFFLFFFFLFKKVILIYNYVQSVVSIRNIRRVCVNF